MDFFEEAVGILLCEVQCIFPLTASQGKRTIAQLQAEYDSPPNQGGPGQLNPGCGHGKGVRGRRGGRGGRGGNQNGGDGARVMINGVDVTDPK